MIRTFSRAGREGRTGWAANSFAQSSGTEPQSRRPLGDGVTFFGDPPRRPTADALRCDAMRCDAVRGAAVIADRVMEGAGDGRAEVRRLEEGGEKAEVRREGGGLIEENECRIRIRFRFKVQIKGSGSGCGFK